MSKELPKLNAEQQNAVDKIIGSDSLFFLIHGVTGSGKTEVYLRVIEDTIKKGKTAILMVPEISLTPQIFNYLSGSIDCGIAVMHSGMSDGQRLDEWRRVLKGERGTIY